LGLIIVLCWIGGLKFADYKADGIVPLVANSPLMSFFYHYPADPAPGIGTGLSDLDSGLRLGYQFSRKFAPYIGYTYSGAFGQTATFNRQAGLPTPRFVFGIWV